MDIRLYYYTAGQLNKYGYSNKFHKFNSLEECTEYVKKLKQDKPGWAKQQFVITKYSGSYSSEIIDIL